MGCGHTHASKHTHTTPTCDNTQGLSRQLLGHLTHILSSREGSHQTVVRAPLLMLSPRGKHSLKGNCGGVMRSTCSDMLCDGFPAKTTRHEGDALTIRLTLAIALIGADDKTAQEEDDPACNATKLSGNVHNVEQPRSQRCLVVPGSDTVVSTTMVVITIVRQLTDHGAVRPQEKSAAAVSEHDLGGQHNEYI